MNCVNSLLPPNPSYLLYLELSSSSLPSGLCSVSTGSAAGAGSPSSPPAGGTSFFLRPGMGMPEPNHPVICDFTLVIRSSLLPPLVGLQRKPVNNNMVEFSYPIRYLVWSSRSNKGFTISVVDSYSYGGGNTPLCGYSRL